LTALVNYYCFPTLLRIFTNIFRHDAWHYAFKAIPICLNKRLKTQSVSRLWKACLISFNNDIHLRNVFTNPGEIFQLW